MTAVGELCVDGCGIRLDVVAQAVGLENFTVASCFSHCILNRGKVWQGGPQNCIIE